jgi:hypothetical protein
MDSAPSLRELQQRLFSLIRAPDGVADGLDRLGMDEEDVGAFVAGDERLSPLGRVAIYADMYFLRLLDVLRGAFPKVVDVLEDDAFAALATDYLEAHPSRNPSLRYLGDRLPAFMREPDAARPHTGELPLWLADLAALEWQRYDVFDAADAPVLAMATLQGLPPEAFASLPVRLVPGHRIVQTVFAVETTWRALSKGTTAGAPEASARTLLVWRQETFVYHRTVDPIEEAALALARDGTTFGVVCEAIAASLEGDADEAAPIAFKLLARWVKDGLLVDTSGGVTAD